MFQSSRLTNRLAVDTSHIDIQIELKVSNASFSDQSEGIVGSFDSDVSTKTWTWKWEIENLKWLIKRDKKALNRFKVFEMLKLIAY